MKIVISVDNHALVLPKKYSSAGPYMDLVRERVKTAIQASNAWLGMQLISAMLILNKPICLVLASKIRDWRCCSLFLRAAIAAASFVSRGRSSLYMALTML